MTKKQPIIEDSPKDLKALVAENPSYIQFIANPSEAIQAVAVKGDVWAIKHITHPTPAIKKYVLSKEPQALVYMEEVTEEEVLMAVKQEGSLIKYLDELTPAIQEAAVTQNGFNIEYIPQPTLEVQRISLGTLEGLGIFRKNRGLFKIEELIEKYPEVSVIVTAIDLDLTDKQVMGILVMQGIDRMWNELREKVIERVTKDGLQLRWLPTQLKTEEICEIALTQNGLALEYVPAEVKNNKLCLLAVSKKPMAIQYVPTVFRSEELCLAAVTGDPNTFNFLGREQRSQAVSEEAVRFMGELFTKIPDESLSEVACRRAVKQKGRLLKEVPERFLTPFLCLCAYGDYEVVDNKQEYAQFEKMAFEACSELEDLLTNGTNSSAIVTHVRMLLERMEKQERDRKERGG